MKRDLGLSLRTLTKRSVWDISENDVFRLWKEALRDTDLKDSRQQYYTLLSTAFELVEIPTDKGDLSKKYKALGYKVGALKGLSPDDNKWAVKKRPLSRVLDLTVDNIHCVSASQLLQLISRNFGGGWDALSAGIQKVITSHFDIATTTLPKNRLHNEGGLYDKKVAEGYEVLEIPKGTWEEVIFAKEKRAVEEMLLQRAAAQQEEEDSAAPAGDESLVDDGSAFIATTASDGTALSDGTGGDDGYFDGGNNMELTIDDIVAAEDLG